MQTDLHRVIRTQHLTDDHCQVSLTVRIVGYFTDLSFYPVLRLPDSSCFEDYP